MTECMRCKQPTATPITYTGYDENGTLTKLTVCQTCKRLADDERLDASEAREHARI